MNVTLKQLRAFLAVARSGSFTRAAQGLHLSQPALTVQIRELEKELGFSVFERTTRAVRLTPLGQAMAQELQGAIEDLESILLRAKDKASRAHETVEIACIPSIAAAVLPSALSAFRRVKPNVNVLVRDLGWKSVVAAVRAGNVSLGIGASETSEPDLQTIALTEDQLCVVFPPDHPLANIREVTLEGVARYPLVLTSTNSSVRNTIKHHFDQRDLLMLVAHDVAQFSSALGLVRAGMGITILPLMAVEQESCRDLLHRPICGATRRIVLLRSPRYVRTEGSEKFVAILSETFAARQADASAVLA